MGRLTVRDCVRGFLKADHLPVCKLAAIVHENHGTHGCANVPGATAGLIDLPSINFDLHCMLTS